MNCPICGAPMIPLFFSLVCDQGCDPDHDPSVLTLRGKPGQRVDSIILEVWRRLAP